MDRAPWRAGLIPPGPCTLLKRTQEHNAVQVVQCLTDLGLSLISARIASDGGWFIDGALSQRLLLICPGINLG